MTLLAGALLPLLQTAGVLDLGEIAIDLGAIVSVTMSAVFLTMNISDMPTAIAEGRVPILGRRLQARLVEVFSMQAARDPRWGPEP